MEQTAVVLSGGGARGAYQIGVWKALRELEIPFDIVTGASVGALNGAMMVQGDFDRALELWNSITTDMILSVQGAGEEQGLPERLQRLGLFTREILRNRGADAAPLRELLRNCLDEDKIRAAPRRLGIITVRLPDFKPCPLFMEDIPRGMLAEYLLASAALYPAMKKQVIGDSAYIDGGFYDNMPVALAASAGARRAVAVDLRSFGLRRGEYDREELAVHTITSHWPLGPVLHFDTAASARGIALGYYDAMKSWGYYEGRLYTFEKGAAAALEEPARELSLRFDGLFAPQKPGIPGLYGGLRLRLLRHLRHMYRAPDQREARRPDSERDMLLAAVENAGRVLELPPTRAYDAPAFRSELLRRYDQTPIPDREHLEALLREIAARGLEAMRESLEGIDRRLLARYCGDAFARTRNKQEAGPLLHSLALALPGEFLAGLYAEELRREGGNNLV